MNKTALKNFATQSRRKLIEQVQTKALLYGIDENNGLNIEEQFGQLLINGQTYPLSMKSAFKALQKQLEQKGYKQLLEEVAYTWFNRIIAIRYMEVHEYMPERVNVLSSTVGRVDPDILFEYDMMDLTIKLKEVRELINAGNTEAAYRILFVAQCNALNRILPFMFEPIQDYTELLLPDFILDAESVIKTLVLSEELTESFTEIEVIGWLYQYYIAEEKDRVFAQKSKYKKEEIPFATQLFTPKWIVQYMVQNSLGRYWTEAHREDEDLIDNWEYFIKHEEEDFHEKIAPYVNKELKVEDIKLLDPAMGSGHILVYAFEVFYEIYEKCGYPERDIPRLILENNLYGLDIDDRAYQLAAFAVVMKAAQYSRRFLRSVEREGIQLNLASIQETNYISNDVIEYIAEQEVGEQYNQVKAFFDQYHNAKTYGSLINITEREISFIEERFVQIENNPVENLFYGVRHEIAKQVLPALIHQTKIMRNEYDVMVMNPPYMGTGNMPVNLFAFLEEKYYDSRLDIFAAFMELKHYLTKSSILSSINQHSWMFLDSFEDLRYKIADTYYIDNMIHLGKRTFEEINGEVVQSTTFVMRNYPIETNIGYYFDLTEVENSSLKLKVFLEKKASKDYYLFDSHNTKTIKGYPIAYWLNDKTIEVFNNKPLSYYTDSKAGLVTGKDSYFLRKWYEVNMNEISFEGKSEYSKFHLMCKGGSHRRFYGNTEYVIKLKDLWDVKKTNKSVRRGDKDYYFKKGISWSLVSNKYRAFRLIENSVCGTASPAIYSKKESDLKYILAFLNSVVGFNLIKVFNQTINLLTSDITSLPLKIGDSKLEIDKLVESSSSLMYKEWSLKEECWEFKGFGELGKSVLGFCETLVRESEEIKSRYYQNLKEINRYFIELYNMHDLNEQPNEYEYNNLGFSDSSIIVRRFLSYFIGVLFGRFQHPNIKFKLEKILLTDTLYFENDIYVYLRSFLSEIYGPDGVDENIEFIAFNLSDDRNRLSENIIRDYFMNNFFVEHCKMYDNLPVYWLVDSGKQRGLRTLVYMHNYQPDTLATIRFEHLQEIQAKYHQEIADLENRLVNPNLSTTDKKKLNAEKVSFEKKIDELREFDKRLAAIATEEITIDLDDGVKVNYEKFYRGGKGVLAKIK